MAGSLYGKNFRVMTFGESHGPAIGAVVDGCPAGLELSAEDIQPFLDRRRPGSPASRRREMRRMRSRFFQAFLKENTWHSDCDGH